MSIRSTPKPAPTNLGAPAAPIQFRDDFVNSSAALAASHDESVRNILSRLDMLQSKVASADGEVAAAKPAAAKTTTKAAKPAAADSKPATLLASDSSPTNLHARLSQLESVHSDHLTRLGSQLNAVEDQLVRNSGDNATIHEISAKFGKIESHIRNQNQLLDRINSLESEVRSLRASAEPHPDQERLLRKINSRLDEFESKRAVGKYSLGARADPVDRPTRAAAAAPPASGGERQQYLAARLDKLKELRSRYE